MLLVYAAMINFAPLVQLANFHVMNLLYGQRFPLIWDENIIAAAYDRYYEQTFDEDLIPFDEDLLPFEENPIPEEEDPIPEELTIQDTFVENSIISEDLYNWFKLERISKAESFFNKDYYDYYNFYYNMSIEISRYQFSDAAMAVPGVIM
jgi:hypothetical protein